MGEGRTEGRRDNSLGCTDDAVEHADSTLVATHWQYKQDPRMRLGCVSKIDVGSYVKPVHGNTRHAYWMLAEQWTQVHAGPA